MRRFFSWLARAFGRGLKWLTYQISRFVTGVTLIGGALVGVTTIRGERQLARLAIAGMIFVVGLPVGLIILGQAFSVFAWLSIVVITLFLMNLHNVWEVVSALRAGGLDHIMIAQAAEAVDGVTPSPEDWQRLHAHIKKVQVNLDHNLKDATDRQLRSLLGAKVTG